MNPIPSFLDVRGAAARLDTRGGTGAVWTLPEPRPQVIGYRLDLDDGGVTITFRTADGQIIDAQQSPADRDEGTVHYDYDDPHLPEAATEWMDSVVGQIQANLAEIAEWATSQLAIRTAILDLANR